MVRAASYNRNKRTSVTFKIQGVSTRKTQIVHANRLKLCKGPLPTEDLPVEQLTEDEPEHDSENHEENDVIYLRCPIETNRPDVELPRRQNDEDQSSETSSEEPHKNEDDEFWDNIGKIEPESEGSNEDKSMRDLSRLAQNEVTHLFDETEPSYRELEDDMQNNQDIKEEEEEQEPSTSRRYPYQTRSQGPVEKLPWVLPKRI